ncbi:hypothetical protein AVEN_93580-1 [Araneus ventricosus]|uniref:Endonuclease/exonuclease/phosphatase domain-containing protein n=1 Tax=Araneus ventricosus TaxID=182803 RepID=A0A4Y2APK9_ARAVE|nr:hypothetical protein AVEN_93580-1 [Araneus ventricosus]
MFLFSALMKYSETSLLIDEEFHIDKDVPIIVMGDFNVEVKRNEKAFGFMKKHFDLNVVPTNYPSTLGNSYIYSNFTRNISSKLLNYEKAYPDLPDGVPEKPSSGAPVVQRQSRRRLVLAEEGRGLHPGVAEFEVFVQVVETVEKVPHVTAQDTENSVVAVMADEGHEVHSHLVEKFPLRDAEHLEKKTHVLGHDNFFKPVIRHSTPF